MPSLCLEKEYADIPFLEAKASTVRGNAFEDYVGVSEQERSLQKSLERLGVPFRSQVSLDLFNVDFLLEEQLVLEVMGHQHFTFANHRNAFSLGREMYLKNMGYHFVYVKTTAWAYALKQGDPDGFLRRSIEKNSDY